VKKLPVVGTSAATTAFCAEELSGPGGLSLWFDGNGKITRDNGTLDAPKPNAFSLRAQAVTDVKAAQANAEQHARRIPPMEDCPGSTPACRSTCYVGGLEQHARSTYDLYEKNSEVIRQVLSEPELADAWVMVAARWIAENVTSFRWHVSGDVFSLAYARWIADVCRESRHIEHWIYTRSFEFLEPLVEVATVRGGNLALNLSADRDNYDEALAASVDPVLRGGAGHMLRVCYLTIDGEVPEGLSRDDVIFPDYALRGGTPRGREWFAQLDPDNKAMVCPVDFAGKSERRRCGPCPRCLV
jgi:hypothetical protein